MHYETAAAAPCFCSRDPFGEKLFYYQFDRRRFVFANEIKDLCADPAFTPMANLSAIRDCLQFERLDQSNNSFFAGVCSLNAGSNLTLDEHSFSIRKYWGLQPYLGAPKDSADAIRAKVTDAIGLRLQTAAPMGFGLAGGLDSSTLAYMAAALRPHTFTAAFDDAPPSTNCPSRTPSTRPSTPPGT